MNKQLFLLSGWVCLALLLMAGYSPSTDPSVSQSLQGVWEMEHQYMYENGEITDTMYNMHGYRQIKMYSGSKVMWSRFNPNDPNEWFGYGTYSIQDGWLEERLEYASGPMMEIVDTTQVFRFQLVIEGDRFRQVALDNNGQRYYSENYRRIE
ncbi:hypothetical protein [Altibacter sp. HG106]|uniref:hypothetical protein n=1 Tax=Altibacter sp. HG106 TaxID=3023937 RepID=UPI00235008CF|nr:hypothetical protein [Altibacter sp. HG106]MDC7994048.1 hypothetical protein [Altibacter sp. HG106]